MRQPFGGFRPRFRRAPAIERPPLENWHRSTSVGVRTHESAQLVAQRRVPDLFVETRDPGNAFRITRAAEPKQWRTVEAHRESKTGQVNARELAAIVTHKD